MSSPSVIPQLDRKQWITVARYAGFFFACFVISFYLTFPRDVLRDFVVQRVEHIPTPTGTMMPSGYTIELDEADTYWLSGIELVNVKITKQPKMPGDAPMVVAFEELTARVSIWNAIFGNRAFSFSGVAGGGDIDGYVKETDNEFNLEIVMDELDLGAMLPSGIFGLPIRGMATSDIDLTFSHDAANSGGDATLTIRDLSLGDGKSELKIPGLGMGMAMDRTRFGTLEIVAPAENGVAQFKKLVAKGPDAQLVGGGKMTLTYPMEQSQTDLLMKFKFTDAYRKKHEWVNGLYSLMDFNPQLKAARTKDEGIQYRFEGAFRSLLRMTPAGSLPAPPGL